MYKKYIRLKDCHNGHVLAKPVTNKYGALIVLENTCVNQYIKSRLEDMEIENVWVYDSIENKSMKVKSNTYEEFKSKYETNIYAIKEVVNELAAGKKLDINRIDNISESLYSELSNTDFIIKCLRDIKETDEYTFTHCINVALYSMLGAKWLKLPPEKIKLAVHSGLLHDIGKSRVPLEILNKPSRLLPEEFAEIKMHTVYGYDMLKAIDNIHDDVRQAVLMHHEREDKTGYPSGTNGEHLNIYAKIVAIADVFDAMTSDRVYKKRATPFEAFQHFSSSLSSFDLKISSTFTQNLSANYIGARVVLNSGETGEIAYIPPHNIVKPVIALKSKFVDTSKASGIKIESIIK